MKTAATLTVTLFSLFLLATAPLCRAQSTSVPAGESLKVTYVADSTVAPTAVSEGESSAADPASPADPQTGAAPAAPATDDGWHISVSPYLWLPGVHGIVGVFNRNVGFSASPSDLLSNVRFGVMGTVEARRKRLLFPIDAFWIRLQADHALPFPNVGANSATVKATEFLLTPKVGYRLLDGKVIKADAVAGIRYWYFGESLSFSPPVVASGLNFSKSQNWVDPVVGGKISAALSPKIGAIIGGDVGGWDTGSHLEYQAFGVLGYKIKPKMTLQAGYRYLYVDYRTGGTANARINLATSGVIIGATWNLK